MPDVLQYAQPTDDEASRVGGNLFKVPKTGQNLSTRTYEYDNGQKATFHKWEQTCVIDDIVTQIEKDDDGLIHESIRIQLRVTDQVKQENAGRVTSDFNHFWWELAKYSDDQIDEWAKKATSQTATPEDKKKADYKKKMSRMSMGCRSMASFCRALGFEDRLASRSVFRGIARIKDVIPHMISKQITVVIEQGEDKNGELRDNIRGYKKV